MEPVCHSLKTWPEHFENILSGVKTFEIRKNDRDFRIGSFLQLFEYDPETKEYSGRWLMKRVTHILNGGQFGIEQGFVVMSLSNEFQ